MLCFFCSSACFRVLIEIKRWWESLLLVWWFFFAFPSFLFPAVKLLFPSPTVLSSFQGIHLFFIFYLSPLNSLFTLPFLTHTHPFTDNLFCFPFLTSTQPRHGKKTRTRGYPSESVPTLTGNTRVNRVWVRVWVFPDNQKSGTSTGMRLLHPSWLEPEPVPPLKIFRIFA